MPKVGTKSFPYTKEGEQRAAAYAAATEQEVVNDNSYGYARGGMYPVKKIWHWLIKLVKVRLVLWGN